MAAFPFELQIDCVSSDSRTESVLCKGHFRLIPGRREVYDAVWRNKGVVVKVFSRRLGAGLRFKKEWNGLRLLESRGVNTPKPLFCGQTPDGGFAVVAEKIADSPTVGEVFDKMAARAEQMDLLVRLCRELANQHEKGVLQNDLHLGNFLLDGERILALDPGQMKFFSRPVTRKKSIRQLALLVCCAPGDEAESTELLSREYFKARRWSFGKSDDASLQRQIKLHTERIIRRQLRKCVRTSKRQLRIKTSRYVAVFDRAFYADAQPRDFVEQIDELMAKGRILKAGNTCCLSRLTWKGRDVVVKRYNHKGFVHSVRHTIKRSRARGGWLHAHRLGMLEIATAKPLAYIEQRKGLLVWKSYLVTEYVEGQQFDSFLQDQSIGREQCLAAIRRTLDMVGKLQDNRITHSDLKHSNILITDHGPVLIDLDAMTAHKLGWISASKGRKYMDLFSKSLEDAL